MWNRNKSLCFLALHCIAAYHSFFNDGSFLHQGTGAPVCIQNWLQKLHFSSLNHLLIHLCSSSSLYPLQSPIAHHYMLKCTNLTQVSLCKGCHQCTNLSQISPFKDDHPMHKSVKSLFREHYHRIHKSHSRIIIRNAHSCLSLFKEHLLPIPVMMPCTRPTTHPRITRYFAPPRGKRWRERERDTEYLSLERMLQGAKNNVPLLQLWLMRKPKSSTTFLVSWNIQQDSCKIDGTDQHRRIFFLLFCCRKSSSLQHLHPHLHPKIRRTDREKCGRNYLSSKNLRHRWQEESSRVLKFGELHRLPCLQQQSVTWKPRPEIESFGRNGCSISDCSSSRWWCCNKSAALDQPYELFAAAAAAVVGESKLPALKQPCLLFFFSSTLLTSFAASSDIKP